MLCGLVNTQVSIDLLGNLGQPLSSPSPGAHPWEMSVGRTTCEPPHGRTQRF